MLAKRDSDETRAAWRRKELERRTSAAVLNCRAVKRALRAAGVRAKVVPAEYPPGHDVVIVEILDD